MTLNEIIDRLSSLDTYLKLCEPGDGNWEELNAEKNALADKLKRGEYSTEYYPMEKNEGADRVKEICKADGEALAKHFEEEYDADKIIEIATGEK